MNNKIPDFQGLANLKGVLIEALTCPRCPDSGGERECRTVWAGTGTAVASTRQVRRLQRI